MTENNGSLPTAILGHTAVPSFPRPENTGTSQAMNLSSIQPGLRVLLATSVIFFSLLARADADDWVMAFHDSRHTGQTSEVVTPPLTLVWTWKDPNAYDTGAGPMSPQKNFWLPIYYRGSLYVQGGNNANRVFCLNPATGSVNWTWNNPGYAQNGTYLFQFSNYPTAVNGQIVNASTDFTAAINAVTGQTTSSTYNTNGGWPSGGAATWNNMAYIQYERTDDRTESFQVVQDPTAWVLACPYCYVSPDGVNTFDDPTFRVPAVDNYTAYVSILGLLSAYDATTGWQKWTYGKQDEGTSPAVANGIVYFYASNLQQMVALNPAGANFPPTGAQVPILWSVSMPMASSPIVSGGTLYVGAWDGYFYALNASTGAVKWTFRTGAAFSGLQIPAISGNLIFVPSADGTLYVLDKNTGTEVWHYTGTMAWGPVIVAGGMVFASDWTNTLYAFQPQSTAVGPTLSSLSATYAPNNAAVTLTLTGSGFFGGGGVSAVQSIYLDNSAGTQLTGYTVTSDQTITGVVVPAGIAPGVYHIKVQTNIGITANEPTFTVTPANSIKISTLGYSTSPGTLYPNQRHLVRTSNGTLLAVYMGPASGEPQYPTYNFSQDGGLTWSGQSQLFLSNQGTVVFAPTSSIWVDSQDQINISSVQWPSYNETFQKFALSGSGVLTQDSGFPVYPSGGTSSSSILGTNIPGSIVAEPGGRLWLVFEQGSNPTGPVLAYYSDNAGVTWNSTPQINVSPGTQPTLLLYKGYPAVVYADGGSLAWSAWNGQSWSSPQNLPGPITGVSSALSAVVTLAGQLTVLYSPASGGVYYTSYDGQSWSSPAALDAAGTSPSVTTDGTNLWAFYTNSTGNLVYRENSSGSWGAPVALTTDGNQNTAAATLALSPPGEVPVLWTAGSSSAGYSIKAAVVPVPGQPVLSVSKTHVGNFAQGQIGATYTVIVSNMAQAGPTQGAATVTEVLPPGLSLVSMFGNGWLCSGAVCTREDTLPGGSSYPPITVTVNVSYDAASPQVNTVNLTGGGSAPASAMDSTSVVLQQVTIQTNPEGLQFSVDGGPMQAAPQTLNLAQGSHTIAVSTTQPGASGTQYVFTSWSDGGAAAHAITVGSIATTYTARFQTQYQLIIAASPTAGGTVTPATGTYYNAGAMVTLDATANTGYAFSSWTGPVASPGSATTTLTMSAAESVVASFAQGNTTAITFQTSPGGLQFSVDGGSPQVAPQILNLSQGSHTIAVGKTQPGAAGTQYVFSAWSDSGAASHTITVGGTAATYTASFQTQYQLTIAASPQAGGTITPAAGTFYNAGAVVTLAAKANTGYAFTSWTGPVASPGSATTTLTMSAAESVVAGFAQGNTTAVTLQTSPANLQVSVDGGPPQTAPQTLNLSQGSHTIAVETTQPGVAGTQYVFSVWSDKGAASHTINVGKNATTYTASFQTQYQLSVATSPSVGGTVTPATGTFYNSGAMVTVTAKANSGYAFSSWTGPVASTSGATTTVTMNAAQSVTANFSPTTAVIIQTSPTGLQFSVDGGALQTAPKALSLSQGSHTIAVGTAQPGTTGTQYVFAAWSDGGAASHSFTVGSTAATYTASFQTQYKLTIAASPTAGGTVSPATGTFYNTGTVVTVTAKSNSGYAFTGWTGSVAGPNSATTTVTMSAAENIAANFSPATAVTIQTSPTGLQFSVDGGPLQTAPQSLNLSQGSHIIAAGTTQPGLPGTQYVFTAWSDKGAASHTITVGKNATSYTASFQTQYQLTIVASPAGAGAVTPATGSFYNAGTAVTISVRANAGYAFTGWTGPAANVSSAASTVTMSAAESVVANFSQTNTTAVTIQTNPAGLQFSVDGGAAQSAPHTLNLNPGSHSIAVAATQPGAAGTQYVFTAWSDSGAANHTITVGSTQTTYTASFQTQYQLTVAASPAADGTVSPATATFYSAGTTVTVAAKANTGYSFSNWTGPVASSANATTTVKVSAPTSVAATFSKSHR